MPAPTHSPVSAFVLPLLGWYRQHHRDLPWRHTQDPYKIWLSEIILQQTRVAQGLPYYERYVAAYPTVADLAAAPEDEVLRLWQGLGYYSRARNLHQTAKQVVAEYEGQFPQTYAQLLQLKGIGPYTAAAIASFAFGEKVAVLDGNVYRVLARYFGLYENTAAPASRKVFQARADALIPEQDPATFNQAIMEFGALHCTPVAPACPTCPVQEGCYAFQHQAQRQLPVKEKTQKIRTRHFTYLVLSHQGQLYLRRRGPKDIWQGLYDFPLIEADRHLTAGPLFAEPELTVHLPAGAQVRQTSGVHRHQLSHQLVLAVFVHAELARPLPETAAAQLEVKPYSAAEAEQLPKPIMIANYLKSLRF